jgi:hypothetical protein
MIVDRAQHEGVAFPISIRVKNGSARARAARLFYPQEQTSSAGASMFVWCHFRTCAKRQRCLSRRQQRSKMLTVARAAGSELGERS